MNNNKITQKTADYIIYILIFCLITLIGYNIYLLVHNNAISNIPPKNSIEVFPSFFKK